MRLSIAEALTCTASPRRLYYTALEVRLLKMISLSPQSPVIVTDVGAFSDIVISRVPAKKSRGAARESLETFGFDALES